MIREDSYKNLESAIEFGEDQLIIIGLIIETGFIHRFSTS